MILKLEGVAKFLPYPGFAVFSLTLLVAVQRCLLLAAFWSSRSINVTTTERITSPFFLPILFESMLMMKRSIFLVSLWEGHLPMKIEKRSHTPASCWYIHTSLGRRYQLGSCINSFLIEIVQVFTVICFDKFRRQVRFGCKPQRRSKVLRDFAEVNKLRRS